MGFHHRLGLVCICLAGSMLHRAHAGSNKERIEVSIVKCADKNGQTCGGGTCTYSNLRNATGERSKDCRTCDETVTVIVVWVGQCTCPANQRGGGSLPCIDLQELSGRDSEKRGAQEVERKLEERKSMCSNSSAHFPCPTMDGVPASNQGQCRNSLLDCFDNNATLARSVLRRQNCSEGQKLCPSVGCVNAEVDCNPIIERCAEDKPLRCRGSLECAANLSSCPARDSATCEGSKILCPDGITCESSLPDCAKRMSWNGPAAGMRECPQRQGVFVDDARNCTALTGCPDGTKFCGFKMTDTMVPLLNATTRRPIANCLAACRDKAAERQLVSDFEPRIVHAGRDRDLEAGVRREGTNATGAVFRVRAGGYRTLGDSAEAVNFSISAVPDSARDQGPFRGLLPLLVSPLITIKPSADVEAVGGGIVLEVPIEDSSITNASTCRAFLANLVVMSVDDIYNASLVPAMVGSCTMGTSGLFTCSCAVNISHFSTYGTAISGSQVDSDAAAAGGTTTTSTSGGGGGGATSTSAAGGLGSGGSSPASTTAAALGKSGGPSRWAGSGAAWLLVSLLGLAQAAAAAAACQ